MWLVALYLHINFFFNLFHLICLFSFSIASLRVTIGLGEVGNAIDQETETEIEIEVTADATMAAVG